MTFSPQVKVVNKTETPDVVREHAPASLPRAYCEMSNETLLIYASRNNSEAVREVMAREIMVVDQVSWHNAQAKLKEMDAANKQGMFVGFLPYKIGIIASVVGGIASLPLTYHLPTILWFNEHYVTADVPMPQ
jgi:hypothetical protein